MARCHGPTAIQQRRCRMATSCLDLPTGCLVSAGGTAKEDATACPMEQVGMTTRQCARSLAQELGETRGTQSWHVQRWRVEHQLRKRVGRHDEPPVFNAVADEAMPLDPSAQQRPHSATAGAAPDLGQRLRRGCACGWSFMGKNPCVRLDFFPPHAVAPDTASPLRVAARHQPTSATTRPSAQPLLSTSWRRRERVSERNSPDGRENGARRC